MLHLRIRIATDLHDDVGANLTRIALLAEVASHTQDRGQLRPSRGSPANRSAR
jgi:signal transduction histidine kinase